MDRILTSLWLLYLPFLLIYQILTPLWLLRLPFISMDRTDTNLSLTPLPSICLNGSDRYQPLSDSSTFHLSQWIGQILTSLWLLYNLPFISMDRTDTNLSPTPLPPISLDLSNILKSSRWLYNIQSAFTKKCTLKTTPWHLICSWCFLIKV